MTPVSEPREYARIEAMKHNPGVPAALSGITWALLDLAQAVREHTASVCRTGGHGKGDGPLACTNGDHDDCLRAQLDALDAERRKEVGGPHD